MAVLDGTGENVQRGSGAKGLYGAAGALASINVTVEGEHALKTSSINADAEGEQARKMTSPKLMGRVHIQEAFPTPSSHVVHANTRRAAAPTSLPF
jgi:hypothetical protein